jgi:hypothetical protein
MAKQLTAAAVQRLRPGKVRREIRDGGCPSLYLIIQSGGHRSWALRFRRPGGKPAKLTLGPDVYLKRSKDDHRRPMHHPRLKVPGAERTSRALEIMRMVNQILDRALYLKSKQS